MELQWKVFFLIEIVKFPKVIAIKIYNPAKLAGGFIYISAHMDEISSPGVERLACTFNQYTKSTQIDTPATFSPCTVT